MFTGIISDFGTVRASERKDSGLRLVIGGPYPPETVALGASIACHGICLTVTEKGTDERGHWFAVDASPETERLTTLGKWQEGKRIHLERALRLGDELGGHLVSGHIDGVATIEERKDQGGSAEFTVSAPSALMPFIAPKGSVALDGTSLTVTWADRQRFGLALIPHTMAVTNWGDALPGSRLNIEIDTMARYAARLREFGI